MRTAYIRFCHPRSCGPIRWQSIFSIRRCLRFYERTYTCVAVHCCINIDYDGLDMLDWSDERQEALDCQQIDADCNDCRFLERGKLAEKVVSVIKTRDGRCETVNHQPNYFYAICLKFNKPTIAQPNKWTGHDCFVHRRELVSK